MLVMSRRSTRVITDRSHTAADDPNRDSFQNTTEQFSKASAFKSSVCIYLLIFLFAFLVEILMNELVSLSLFM
jgi:hypothetical protein